MSPDPERKHRSSAVTVKLVARVHGRRIPTPYTAPFYIASDLIAAVERGRCSSRRGHSNARCAFPIWRQQRRMRTSHDSPDTDFGGEATDFGQVVDDLDSDRRQHDNRDDS